MSIMRCCYSKISTTRPPERYIAHLHNFAALLASLFISSGFVVAQINVPDCNSTSWQWTFNSLGQNLCTVLAYMISTCNGGEFTVFQLQSGWVYFGPSGIDNANLCECSLYSACGACQQQKWVTWSQWVTNCTRTLPPSSRVPCVAAEDLLPLTCNRRAGSRTLSLLRYVFLSGFFLMSRTRTSGTPTNRIQSVTPELGPGAVLGPSGVSSSSASPTISPTPSPPPLTEGGANTGSSLSGTLGSSDEALCKCFHSQSSAALFCDPNDPTTFPGYQGALQSPATSQGPVPSHCGTGNSQANVQTSRPQGYHGLPVV
ncbi:hypothetical protein F5888DRAFT_1736763 [Russula emetica]|nr:hypothetical protein F5888DRAFT_1736763 [Russula emetica]